MGGGNARSERERIIAGGTEEEDLEHMEHMEHSSRGLFWLFFWEVFLAGLGEVWAALEVL